MHGLAGSKRSWTAIIGHSLGGGVAMQFVHDYPERCERLVLIASGGLGPEVSIALRAATLPGVEHVLAIGANPWLLATLAVATRLGAAAGVRGDPGLAEAARSCVTLADSAARRSFLSTLRAVIDHRGQRVSALNRIAAIECTSTLIIWGAKDRIIPVRHAHDARRAIPNSRLVVLQRAGHFPHVTQRQRCITAIEDFMDQTAPAAATQPATSPHGTIAAAGRSLRRQLRGSAERTAVDNRASRAVATASLAE